MLWSLRRPFCRQRGVSGCGSGITDTERRMASGLGWQARRLPGKDAAGQVTAIGVALLLRRKRSGHRAAAGAASEHHLTALRLRNGGWVEFRKRHNDRARITLDHNLIELAHIDQ